MAIEAEESSSTLLPARPIFIKNKCSAQALRTGVTMPTYTIAEDPPWITSPGRASHARSSVYSDDFDEAPTSPDNSTPNMPKLNLKPSYHPSYHAHPKQEITDTGPQVRQSRLPIFKQVRSMLQKPPPLVTPGNANWDEHSGELSENGRAAQVKPSTYVSPYEGACKARRHSPERQKKAANKKKSVSPVSVLTDQDEVKPPVPLKAGRNSPRLKAPVSPVSPVSPIDLKAPSALSANERSQPLPMPKLAAPSIKSIKRKQVPSRTYNSPSENMAPQHSPSINSDRTEPPEDEGEDDERKQRMPNSHFSWTTIAPSEAPRRPSVDITAPRACPKNPSDREQSNSRFSWSTVNTTTTYQARPDSPPPSPPPPIPAKYTNMSTPTPAPQRTPAVETYTPTGYGARQLPVQSILSRQRPIQRNDRQEWTPPPRDQSRGTGTTPRIVTTPVSATPVSAKSAVHPAFRKESPFATSHANSSEKKLPLAPELAAASATISHLDSLLAQEKDLVRQRQNVEKGIRELEKVEKASPMEVDFATVRDAKRRLEEHRRRLEEVKLEEREVGILISRVRRKEGEEEGLWVRRVTG